MLTTLLHADLRDFGPQARVQCYRRIALHAELHHVQPVVQGCAGSAFQPALRTPSHTELLAASPPPQVPGVNQVIRGKTLPLTGVEANPDLGWAAGKYTFQSSAFFPIDNQEANEAPDDFYGLAYPSFQQVGLGNQAREHNFHFCTEIHTVQHIVHHIVHHILLYVAFTHGTTLLHHNSLSCTMVLATSNSWVTMTSGSSSTTASR